MERLRCGLRTMLLMTLIMGLSWFPGAKADLNDGLVAYYHTQADLEAAREEGQQACKTNPASCGITIKPADCSVVYENGNLHMPCVKVIDSFGNEVHYEADMQLQTLNPMTFQVTGAKPK